MICGGLVAAVLLQARGYDAGAARAPSRSSGVPSAAAGPVIAVIGDESALDAENDVTSARRWPALLAGSTGGHVVLLAATGAGYAVRGATGDDFRTAARRVPADAAVVLIVGGAADRSRPRIRVARAMTEAFSAVHQRAPSASIIAVGPFFVPAASDGEDVRAVQRTLRSAGGIADVQVVDPFMAGWSLAARSAAEVRVQDERSIARALAGAVRSALG